jgi:transmembrane sensor
MRVLREAAMSDTPDWSAIDRYLTGAPTPDDTREVDAWIAADSRNAALLEALRTDGDDAADAARWNVDAAWARVAPRLTVPAVASPPVAPSRVAPRDATGWRAAAALLLIAAGGATWWRVAAGPTEAAAETRERSTAPGQRASFELVDGSRVTLNAGSRLRWRADYGARTRDVQLEGEGYFEVRHDRARPFRVHARGAVAEDLGTRFTVRAYPRSRASRSRWPRGASRCRRSPTRRARCSTRETWGASRARGRAWSRAAPRPSASSAGRPARSSSTACR